MSVRVAASLVGLLLATPAYAEPPPRFGFTNVGVPKKKAEELGIEEGTKITSVVKGCAAEKALQKGDIVYLVAGEPVRNLADVQKVKARHKDERSVMLPSSAARSGSRSS